MQENKTNANIFFFAIFLGLLYVSYLMFQPFIGSLIFGGILAGTFLPFNNMLMSKYSLSRTISSSLTCACIFLLVVLPFVYIIYQLSRETIDLYGVLKQTLNEEEVKNFLFGDSAVAKFFREVLEKFNVNVDPEAVKGKILSTSQVVIGSLVKNVNSLLGNLLNFIINFLIMFVATFSFLSQGPRLKEYMFRLSPLSEEEEELILSKFNQMNYVSIYCNGIGGVIQGGLAGLAFYFAGLSSVFLWTTMMIILAFIPLVGISVVYVPAAIYLWIKGYVLKAVVLFVFCTVLSLWTENVFKPKFIGERVQVDSMIMLLFILGGMSLFGMAGIFYGPILCILLLTMIELYHQKYKFERL